MRKRACTAPEKRPASALERAQHINSMQSRTFHNQLEVLENSIQRKLKVDRKCEDIYDWGSTNSDVIENEKLQVANYLHFLKSSSGESSYSIVPQGRLDTPRVRPATAGLQRMKFGGDGNANHSYMTSDPKHGWKSYNDSKGTNNDVRAKSACMSRMRMTSHRTTMSRIQKIEEPLRKRVSWIDGGDGGDEGIRGYSAGIRAYSAKRSPTRPHTASSSTQYDPDYSSPPDYVLNTEPETTGSLEKPKKNSNKLKREVKTIQPINITFPFPVTPDRYKEERTSIVQSEKGNQFMSHDKRRGLMATVLSTPRK